MIRKKIFKKSLILVLTAVLLCGILMPRAAAAEAVELTSPSAIVTELTSGTTLLSSQPDKKVNPGSIVKVFSLYVLCPQCFEGRADLRDRVTVTEHDPQRYGRDSAESGRGAQV